MRSNVRATGRCTTTSGVRTGGPAPRPMDYMTVRVDEATGNVTVDTGDINQRLAYSPEQAVPYPA